MHPLPPQFIRNITMAFPENPEWLTELPTLIAEAATRWSLTVGDPVPNLSFNYVCFVTRADGTPAILKLGVPRDEIRQEIEALKFYNGQRAARVLESDVERGWMLLERIFPGKSLLPMAWEDDDQATRILAEMMLKLCVPLPAVHPFQPITEWAAGFNVLRQQFDGGTGPLNEALIARSEALFAATVAQPVLLHGDFHHDNVLQKMVDPDVLATQPLEQWVMIDPKGMAGAMLADIGPLFYNPLDFIVAHPDLARLSARRVAILSEILGAERDLIIEWGIALCMLSAWWSIEDESEQGWRMTLHVAETLSKLKV